MEWRISIRSKILIVLSTVVIAAIALYLYLASRIFYEDKTLLIYELNQTNVRTLGADTETNLKRALDKLRMATVSPTILALIGEKDEDFVSVGRIRKEPDGTLKSETLMSSAKHLEVYGKNAAYLDQVREKFPIPYDRVLELGTWVRNVTFFDPSGLGESLPLMTIATAVEDLSGVKSVLYADLKLDSILKSFSGAGVAKAYLVDSDGYTLAHSEAQRVSAQDSLASDPLIQRARAQVSTQVRSEVKKFEDGDRAYLGAFYRLSVPGVVVASKIELEEAFAAARLLLQKSLLYALIVITAAFLVALFFSHSLTDPILRLVEATRRIASGDFNLSVPISSRDELATLAASFNSMTLDLKTSRNQIEEYSRDLEKKVAERTVKLEAQNIAIKEAQEALITQTRLASVGEIAGRAAHEVLNPLTGITSRLEKIRLHGIEQDAQDLKLLSEISGAWSRDLAEKGKDGLVASLSAPSTAQPGKTLLEEDVTNLQAIAKDVGARLEQRRGDLEFLMREAGRIAKIVNGMRQLTRVSGTRRKVNVHELLGEALATMNDLLGKYGIRTETQFCDGAPRIYVDHDEMLQVLSNILRNSMQALTAKDGGRIWIRTERRVVNGRARVWIHLSDNGPGIAIENFEKVFEPSFTTKQASEGTGLGLAICRRFIRAYEGEIMVGKSVPGEETSFLIDLPEHTENANS